MSNNSPKVRLREFAQVLFGYVLLIAVGYLPVVFLGRTLDPAVYVDLGTTRSPSVLNGRRPVPTVDVDIATPANYEWPVNRLVGHMWRAGEVPLWNPYQGMGAPLAAQYSSRAFFPYQIIEDMCPVKWGDFFLLGRIFIAAVFTWLFLRCAGASFVASFLGGALYAFSGTWSWLGNLEQLANVAMMLPVFLWTIERLVDDLRPREVALAGLAVGLILLAGQPETALYVLALGGIRVLHKLWPRRASGDCFLRGMLAFSAAAVLGILLASPLLLLFWHNMQQAFHLHHGGGMMGVQSPMSWTSLAAIWTPALYSHPVAAVRWPDNGHWDYMGGFSGILPWVLILGGLIRTGFRGALGFFAGAAFFILLKDLGVWPFVLIGRLPIFDQAWTPRWAGPVWTLALAAAAAFAADVLTLPLKRSVLQVQRNMIIGGGFLLFVCYFYWLHFFLGAFYTPAVLSNRAQNLLLQEPNEWVRNALGGGITLMTAMAALLVLRSDRSPRSRIYALLAIALGELWFAMPRAYPVSWTAATVVIFVLSLATAWSLLRDYWRLAAGFVGAAALSLMAVDLLAPRGLPDRGDAYAETPGIAFLRAHLGYDRIMATDGVLPSNAASAMGLMDLRYIYALAPEQLHAFESELLSPPRSPYHQLWSIGMNETKGQPFAAEVLRRLRAYSLVGMRYLVVPCETPPLPGLTKVYDGEVAIYENPGQVPRARIVHQAIYAASLRAALGHMGDPALDPKTTAVLVGRPVTMSVPTSPSHAVITSYAPSRVEVDAALDSAGVLVLTDVYDPDWSVSIDKQPGRIFPADFTFRGVALPAGHHRVVFTYNPAVFTKGLFAAAAALLICLALCLADFLLRRAGAVKLEAGV